MRTSRRNHRGCLFLVFHGNVVWICSVSWSGLFSVTVLMSHNYSVLKCLCLVFFFLQWVKLTSRRHATGLRALAWMQRCLKSLKVEHLKWKAKRKKRTVAGGQLQSTTCLRSGSNQRLGDGFQPVTLALCLLLKCKLRDVNMNSKVSSDFCRFPLCGLVETVSQSAESYFLASWKGCWPFKHRRERTLIISDTQGH